MSGGSGWLRPAAETVARYAARYPSTEAERELSRIHIKVPALLRSRLAAYSLKSGQTRSSLIRVALHEYLQARGF